MKSKCCLMPLLAVAGCFFATFPLRAGGGAAFLNPSNFASLGAFNPPTNVLVDLGGGQMSGGASFTGVKVTQANTALLVFTFASFNLNSGTSITFSNAGGASPAVAFLSQGDMTVAGAIYGSGFGDPYGAGSLNPAVTAPSSSNNASGGPGAGNANYGSLSISGNVGPSPGSRGGSYFISTNTSNLTGGGGGAFGGIGGNGGYASASQGDTNSVGFGATNTYNADLSSELVGGSGGGWGTQSGGGAEGIGGGGGGALQLGALGSLTVSGVVDANGGRGGNSDLGYTLSAATAGGGGGGGGILIQGNTVTITSNATVSAAGGGGGDGAYQFVNVGGGGGGGGRIYIGYFSSGTTNGATLSINGGFGGSGSGGAPTFGVNGTAGTIAFVQSALVPHGTVTQAPALAGTLMAGSLMLLSWPSSATNFTLETTPALGAGANWTAIPGPYATAGGNFVLTNSINGSATAFFRLRQQ